jgi:hypothetical protein
MKYRRRAADCDLVCFQPGDPLPADVRVRFGGEDRYEVWNALHGSWIGLSPGDYLNVTTPGDHYPVKRAVVDAHYERIDEG